MAFIPGNRTQQTFLPPVIDDYVNQHDPVRVYDAFVESLDFKTLGISFEPQGGADEYCPKAMLKLIIYGCSYGIRTSRKLERACHHNMSFIWLTGGLKPDYRTISRFRKRYKKAITNVLKQCARMCIKLKLIEGNILFVDGSKMRANASIKNTWTQKKCNKMLKKIDERIDALQEECESEDAQEENQESLVKAKENLKDQE
ncbi:MAG: transposase, partial [Candidatus Omnitrophica bacterium]|nr:transposase [Candidatus Omnitrophota bacterium]